MASYIAIFLSLVSIILMIIILIRFKRLFSADSIIEKTKSQMNRVIMDVNNNANRDLELINDSTRRLKALLNDAEKRMESFREASQLLRDMIAEVEKAGNNRQKRIDPDTSYRVRNSAAGTGNENQRSLFDDVEEPQNDILKDETIVTPDGAAYKEVPLIITKVYDDKTTASIESKVSGDSKPEKNIKERVEKLFNQGMQIEDIAQELSCPVSEVQFIIDIL